MFIYNKKQHKTILKSSSMTKWKKNLAAKICGPGRYKKWTISDKKQAYHICNKRPYLFKLMLNCLS